jgi:hypothetical protein
VNGIANEVATCPVSSSGVASGAKYILRVPGRTQNATTLAVISIEGADPVTTARLMILPITLEALRMLNQKSTHMDRPPSIQAICSSPPQLVDEDRSDEQVSQGRSSKRKAGRYRLLSAS